MKKRFILIAPLIFLFLAPAADAEEKKDAKNMLDIGKLVVTASRVEEEYRDSTQDINIIDSEDIEDSYAVEATDLLSTLPAVNVISYGSYGATKTTHVRGADASQTVTLVNGRPVNTPRDGLTDFNQIPLNNIERIEVLKGPTSSIYGANAVGGVINIITKSGKEKMFTEVSAQAGSFFTSRLDFANGWKKGGLDYFISGNLIQSDGYRNNSDYEQQNYDIKLGYDLNKENRLIFNSGYVTSETGTPGRNSNEDPDDRQEKRGDYFDLTWEGTGPKDTDILLKTYQNLDRIEFIESLSPVTQIDTNQTTVYGADLQLSRLWFDTFRTIAGVSGQENRLNSSTSSKHRYNFKAAYGELEAEFFDDIVLKGGARIDDYSNFGSRASPSASFSWWLFDTIKMHGLWGKSFRTPTFNDLYWPKEDYGPGWGGVEGNPNLKPERSSSSEIGVGTYLFGRIETDLTYFYTKSRDMIAWTMDDTFWWRPTNVNSAVIKGVEANFTVEPVKNLKLNANYTRLSAIDTATKKWLIYRPRHECKGTISYLFNNRLNLYVTGRYLTKRYTTESNSRFLKPFFVADANIEYELNRNSKVTLGVTNIFDKNYEEQEDYPAPPFSFLLGLKFTV
ncbi:MAG: TonB-dependent receptor [Candidatus Omnitrophica bacterium]|nr:TonB-dependent receptor [Candidatus Omnitrophota bacterium]